MPHIELSVAYAKQGAATDAEAVPTDAKAFAFENSYSPKPAAAAISGTKVFQGRAMTEAESFGFSLVPANKAATDAFGADFAKQATVSGLWRMTIRRLSTSMNCCLTNLARARSKWSRTLTAARR
mgnify:CR=1 FL=1